MTFELLDELEQRWRRIDAPIVDRLQPGLTDEQMDELTAPLGLTLPMEARRWWGWHDGVDPASARIQSETMIGPLWRYQPLGALVASYRTYRDLSDELDPHLDDPDRPWWDPAWFPVCDEPWFRILACDCSVAPGHPTPIRSVHAPREAPRPEPSVTSFGDLVSRWIEAIDIGYWYRDPHLGWIWDDDHRPPDWQPGDIL